jgi:hypothetical protein
MKNLSSAAKIYIIGTILIAVGLIAWMSVNLDWSKPGLYLLVILGAAAQTLKVEGPNNRTNYSIAWFAYGLAFIALGPAAALFIVVVSHIVEWAWHKYPWYIQSFNIANHVIAVYLAGVVYQKISAGTGILDLPVAMGIVAANLVFVLGNHFLVGVVIKLARGQSFAESGVFGALTLFLDFTILSMGTVTAFLWLSNPLVSVLNIMPLYLLYNALRVPALTRELQESKKMNAQTMSSGD